MIKFDISDLVDNIKKDLEITEKQLVDLQKKVTLDVEADLVLATPVDTGRARQGWEVTTPQKFGDDGVIENSVPYIEVLNNGHSKQSPAGFIETIVQKYNGSPS
jgi:hypothetical protein